MYQNSGYISVQGLIQNALTRVNNAYYNEFKIHQILMIGCNILCAMDVSCISYMFSSTPCCCVAIESRINCQNISKKKNN